MKNNLFTSESEWIWLPDVESENCYLEFREEFEGTDTSETTQLYLSAEGQYVAFLDGQWLCSTQYPDFPAGKSVQCIPLPPGAGVHRLTVQVRYPGTDTSVCRREVPGVRFEVRQGTRLLSASRSGTPARPLAGYKSGAVPNISGQLGAGFAWSVQPKRPWQSAVAVEKECRLIPRPIPELTVEPTRIGRLLSQGVFVSHESGMQQYAALSYRELYTMTQQMETRFPAETGIRFATSEGDGIYLVLDLGQETAGYLDIDAVCPVNTRVEIGFGEHLNDLRVRTEIDDRRFVVDWETGTERRRFVHRFLRLGGRYLQLFVHGHEVTLYHAGLQPVVYPVRAKGTFSCADRLLTRIFRVSEETLLCSMHEHYEDCPWREQALYTFDSRNQMLAGYYAFGEFTQPRESLRTMAQSLREDGLLELCAPARVSVDIPCFSLIFIVALEEYCRYSGDLAFGEEMLSTAAVILRTFHERLKDGLMYHFSGYWNFYEWRPLLDGLDKEPMPAAAPLQLYYLLTLQRMERICGWLNRDMPGLSEEKEIVKAGLEVFWNGETAAYATYLQEGQQVQFAELTQALALYTEACPVERRQELCRKLLKNELEPISLSASIFKYDALLTYAPEHSREIFDCIAERWGRMLYQGATTFWETDEGADYFSRAGSLCHGWSAIPAYLIGAYVLGIQPTEPGIWEQKEMPEILPEAEGTLYPPEGRMRIQCRER